MADFLQLMKNHHRVLPNRGMKGCYVRIMNKNNSDIVSMFPTLGLTAARPAPIL